MRKKTPLIFYFISIVGMAFSGYACDEREKEGPQSAPLSSSLRESRPNNGDGEKKERPKAPHSPKQGREPHASVFYNHPLKKEEVREILDFLVDTYDTRAYPKDTPFLTTRSGYDLTIMGLSFPPFHFDGKELVIEESKIEIGSWGLKIFSVKFRIKDEPTEYRFTLNVKNKSQSIHPGQSNPDLKLNKNVVIIGSVEEEKEKARKLAEKEEKARKLTEEEKARKASSSGSPHKQKRGRWKLFGRKRSSSNEKKEESIVAPRVTRATTTPPQVYSLSHEQGSTSKVSHAQRKEEDEENKSLRRSSSLINIKRSHDQSFLPASVTSKSIAEEASSPNFSRNKEETPSQPRRPDRPIPLLPQISSLLEKTNTDSASSLSELEGVHEINRRKVVGRSRSLGPTEFDRLRLLWAKREEPSNVEKQLGRSFVKEDPLITFLSSTSSSSSPSSNNNRIPRDLPALTPPSPKPPLKVGTPSKGLNGKKVSSPQITPVRGRNMPLPLASSPTSSPLLKQRGNPINLPKQTPSFPVIKRELTTTKISQPPLKEGHPSSPAIGKKSSPIGLSQQKNSKPSPVLASLAFNGSSNPRSAQTNQAHGKRVPDPTAATRTYLPSLAKLPPQGTVKKIANNWPQNNESRKNK